MIEASFDRMSRRAAIDGAYQYDTGQRLRLNGLSSPAELGDADDFVAGDSVTVQVHYGYDGDSQTNATLAVWDEDRWCWLADIPDEYLTKNEPVHVYVYVYHGETEEKARAHTVYEGVFTPAYRPAPNNVASDDMINTWNELAGEVDLVLVSADSAIKNAEDNAEKAEKAAEDVANAAQEAEDATEFAQTQDARLDAQEARWNGMDVRVVNLPAGSDAEAILNGSVLTLGLPQGATGPQGAVGDTGPSDIGLSISDGVLTITPR